MNMLALSKAVSSFDLWGRVCDDVEALPSEKRFDFTCRDLHEISFFEAASEGDPAILRSGLAVYFEGTFGLIWYLWLRVDAEKALVSAEFVSSHYEAQGSDQTELLFQKSLIEVEEIAQALDEASKILTDNVIQQITSGPLRTHWELSGSRNLADKE
ncbi:hypothetical protein DESA109040_02065 [Deinococcus saxicola]|uniref:hypothetical protein n=1 Tax=Deinococcus saxicola TaxID=249406 RepID=UPI0039EE04A8